MKGQFAMDKYEKLHRDMWHYIAQRTRETKLKADKDSYLFIVSHILEPKNKCFACAQAYRRCVQDNHSHHYCTYCPIKWGTEEKQSDIFCAGKDTLFSKWLHTADWNWQVAADLAEQIAEMKWR